MKDISIHFTIKEQPLEHVKNLFYEWHHSSKIFNEENTELKLHNCFLPLKTVVEKNLDTDLIEFIDSLTNDNSINWFYAGETVGMSRLHMLENIYRLGGVALFVGDIKDGVKEEFELAKQIGVSIIEIFTNHIQS